MTAPSPPTTAEALADLPLDEVGRLLGSPVVRATHVSRLRSPRSPRSAFRATLADGREVKVRRLLRPERAADLAALLDELADPAFPRALHRVGGVLVEPWIEGPTLDVAPRDPARLEDAGALLGRLHARPRAAGRALHGPLPTAPHRKALREHLADLVRQGALASPAADEVEALVAARDPGAGTLGLCHGDFAAENLLVGASGTLHAIDNEDLGLDAVEFDLALALYRFSFAADDRRRFLAGYARHRDPIPALAVETFWRGCAVVRSAHVRAVRLGVDPATPLRAIADLRAGAGEGRA